MTLTRADVSMEAGTVPEKVTISHRGSRYEIGIGKRYYAIWAVGAARTDPVDRWPETPEGWSQAWARFTALEVPGTIMAVPRKTLLATLREAASRGGRATAGDDGDMAGAAEERAKAALRRATVGRIAGTALLAAGVVAGVVGLFPDYFTLQSLASSSDQLVPHVLYLAGWAAAAVLVPLGKARTRAGALLAAGLAAVTFGLFAADLATGTSSHGGVGTGMILSLLGWLACAIGAVLALRVPVAAPGTASPAGTASQAGIVRRGLALPRKPGEIGAVVLLAACAIGAAWTFIPSWDKYTLVQSSTGTSVTQTAGNAFQNPGTVIAGDMAAVVALVVVAILAALWRPARYGAALVGGAVVALIAQGVSGLIQASQPAAPEVFGISAAQAQADGVTISSGLTDIFWVFCVFVLALALSSAWLLTAPAASSPGSVLVSPVDSPDYQAPNDTVPASDNQAAESPGAENSAAQNSAAQNSAVENSAAGNAVAENPAATAATFVEPLIADPLPEGIAGPVMPGSEPGGEGNAS